MERLILFVSGKRVVSWPWNQETVDPLDTDGLMKGGAVHAGMPWLRIYAGVTPPAGPARQVGHPAGNVCVSVKPMLWVDPVTDMSSPKKRPYEPRMTVL